MSELINTVYLFQHGDERSSDAGGSEAAIKAKRDAYKRIELRLGDLVETYSDLIVSSSSSGDFPNGAVVRRLSSYFGLRLTRADQSEFTPLIRVHGNSGTWLYNRALPTGQRVMVTAISRRGEFEPQFDTLITALTQLDADQLCDERGQRLMSLQRPLSIAMPILAGNRSYPPRERMRYIVDECVKLLERAQALECIELYIYEHREAEEWSKYLDLALGRDVSDQSYPFRAACKELSQLIIARLSALLRRGEVIRGLRREVLSPLYRHFRSEPPCLSTLAAFARKSWEAVVLELSKHSRPPSGDVNLNASFSSLLKMHFNSDGLSDAWVALRVTKALGNAASHLQSSSHPLSSVDYPILLLVLERFMGFVSPFDVKHESMREALYDKWSARLQESLTSSERVLRERDLWLDSWLALPSSGHRKKRIKTWYDQVIALQDPDREHRYWAYSDGEERLDLDQVVKVTRDLMPGWISVHLVIWSAKVNWECANPEWARLYDLLSRWRLSEFAHRLTRAGAMTSPR